MDNRISQTEVSIMVRRSPNSWFNTSIGFILTNVEFSSYLRMRRVYQAIAISALILTEYSQDDMI